MTGIIRPARKALYKAYIEEDLTQKQTAKKFGVCYATMNKWLQEEGLHKDSRKPDRMTLFEMNRKRKMTAQQMGEALGVSPRTVYDWMRKEGLPMKGGHPARIVVPSKQELYRLYISEDMDQAQIAQHYGVCIRTVTDWIGYYGIHKPLGAKSKNPGKKVLHDLYIKQGLSLKKIAKRYGVHQQTVSVWLKKEGIQTRPWRNH